MIKRVIYIVLFFLCTMTVAGQVVMPLGYGLPYQPLKMSESERGFVAACADNNDSLVVFEWNGHFWNELEKPSMPTLGDPLTGNLRIVDIVGLQNDKVYVAVSRQDTTSTSRNYIFEWSSIGLSEVSNSATRSALNISGLVNFDNSLQCIGQFQDGGQEFNIMAYSTASSWTGMGNTILRANTPDKITSVSQENGKLYTTGQFVDANGQHSLAVWDGSNWDIAQYPAFLGDHEVSGEYDGRVVIYGKSTFEAPKIKVNEGNAWKDISSSMTDFSINSVDEFASVDSRLFVLGSFNDQLLGGQFNLLAFDGEKWTRSDIGISNISVLASNSSDLVVGGNFGDSSRINHIGIVNSSHSVIESRVYYDLNANCIKDPHEEWAKNFPITIGESISSLNTDRNGMAYVPALEGNYKLNAAPVLNYENTCADKNIVVFGSNRFTGNEFGIRKKVMSLDAQVELSDMQSLMVKANDVKRIRVCAKNQGFMPISNYELVLQHGSSLTNFTSELPFETYTDGTAKWKINNLNDNEEQCFIVTFDVIDDQNASVFASLTSLDGNLESDNENNGDSILYTPGSTEPNYKYCGNGKEIEKETEVLSYKIGFKNLGDETVNSIKIVDQFDTMVHLLPKGTQLTTPFNSNQVDYLVTADINNEGYYYYKMVSTISAADLMSHNEDEAASEGYIDVDLFLKPNSLVLGKSLCNTADIFFSTKKGSWSEPFSTNTVCSEVVEMVSTIPVGLPTNITGLDIGPNPASNTVHINNGTSEDYKLTLLDIFGKEMSSVTVQNFTKKSMDISGLSSGVYFIYVEDQFVQKLLIK